MHDQNNSFTCHWQPSLRVSLLALLMSLLACIAVAISALAWPWKTIALTVLVVQTVYQLMQILRLQQPSQRRGLRHTAQGWQIWDAQQGWRAVQLRADSIAIPLLVLLRYRYANQWFYRTLLVGVDSLSSDSHRRLRVRLKFSRQRWQAVK